MKKENEPMNITVRKATEADVDSFGYAAAVSFISAMSPPLKTLPDNSLAYSAFATELPSCMPCRASRNAAYNHPLERRYLSILYHLRVSMFSIIRKFFARTRKKVKKAGQITR